VSNGVTISNGMKKGSKGMSYYSRGYSMLTFSIQCNSCKQYKTDPLTFTFHLMKVLTEKPGCRHPYAEKHPKNTPYITY
jgi:hypothetical protein